jgi:ATP-dependent 26S proteasome regulatory subunit
MARRKEEAERFLSNLRLTLRKRNVYRGHVLSMDQTEMRELQVKFHRLPKIERANIILPDGLLERIERQTIDFSRHSAKLLSAGRHLKRGLLLFGAPGTGKTLTAMYLASAVRDRTVLLLTGRGLGLLAQSCSMARALQPSIVVLEDVDLVAEERTARSAGCAQPLLFELLNEMDGLADDADVLFLLTTNRADLLEPALAARPGRIDQSFEIPLPDASCRQRLFNLYGRGLTLRNLDLPRFIERTDGASAAFIRELMRKAALFAADEGEQLVVSDRQVDEALHELLVEGGELTKSLLGFRTTK